MLAREHCRGASSLAVLEPLAQGREVELRNTCTQRGDLAA
jgi:hypothetical protein